MNEWHSQNAMSSACHDKTKTRADSNIHPFLSHSPLGGQTYHLGTLKLFDELLTDARIHTNVLYQLVEEARCVPAGGEEGAGSSLVECQVAQGHRCCISNLTIKTDDIYPHPCLVSWLNEGRFLCLMLCMLISKNNTAYKGR